MMKAYLDESTDGRRAQVFSIAGWLGTEYEWTQFELDWRGRTSGIGAVFHMTECETNKGQFSPEKGWDKSQCTRLIADLVTSINHREVVGFGRAID